MAAFLDVFQDFLEDIVSESRRYVLLSLYVHTVTWLLIPHAVLGQ